MDMRPSPRQQELVGRAYKLAVERFEAVSEVRDLVNETVLGVP